MQKYGFSAEDANAISSIVYVISAVASPLFGFVIDKTGRNVMWIVVSIISTVAAHSLLAFTYLNPYIGMVSSLWFSESNRFDSSCISLERHGSVLFDVGK